jgi:hypothetical protein
LDIGSGNIYVRTGTTYSNTISPYSGDLTIDYGSSPNVLKFTTGATERMRLDTSGNLGLGVTPSAWSGAYKAIEFPGISVANLNSGINQQAQYLLNAYDSGAGAWKYKVSSVSAAMYRQSSDGSHEWHRAPSGTAGNAITFTQAMTLDASGNLGVGNTSPSTAGVGKILSLLASGATAAQIKLQNSNTGATSSDGLLIGLDASTSDGYFFNYENTALIFGTNNAERARITSGGDLLVGTTDSSLTTGNGIKLLAGTAAGENLVINSSASTNANEGFMMYSTGASAYRFYVQWDGTINATSATISAISDQRFKENIQDLDVGLDKIMALKPRRFDWKAGKGKDIKGDRGFIAQEFEQVFPDLIDEWKDPAPEGEEPYKSVRQDLIPVLVKAMQEQQALIESLTTRVAQLEGA